MSAYNIFFQVFRKRIVEGREDEPFSDSEIEEHLSKGRPSKNKRPHRKSHGKISFKNLARRISEKWKTLSGDEMELFKSRSEIDRARYAYEVATWRIENKKVSMVSSSESSSINLTHSQSSSTPSTGSTPPPLSRHASCATLPEVTPSPVERPRICHSNFTQQHIQSSMAQDCMYPGPLLEQQNLAYLQLEEEAVRSKINQGFLQNQISQIGSGFMNGYMQGREMQWDWFSLLPNAIPELQHRPNPVEDMGIQGNYSALNQSHLFQTLSYPNPSMQPKFDLNGQLWNLNQSPGIKKSPSFMYPSVSKELDSTFPLNGGAILDTSPVNTPKRGNSEGFFTKEISPIGTPRDDLSIVDFADRQNLLETFDLP